MGHELVVQHNEQHLEELVTELLDRHDILDILSEICARAYDRKSAFEMVGDRHLKSQMG